jgi:hypothetical protein
VVLRPRHRLPGAVSDTAGAVDPRLSLRPLRVV